MTLTMQFVAGFASGFLVAAVLFSGLLGWIDRLER